MTATLAFRQPRATRAVVALLASLALLSVGTPAVHALGRMVSVVVMAGSAADAGSLVQDAGGEVTSTLPVIDGVGARVPEGAIGALGARALVAPDYPLRVQSNSYGDNLVSAYPHEVGAPDLWRDDVTGEGVTVALIDTGVADVPDLQERIVAEANFTNEPTFEDTYGHGTFQAGLIAGSGASSDGRHLGVAPDASLLSVKVAGADGSTSLGQVLAGVQLVDWSARRFNVRVALLALSSSTPLPPEIDPLSRALRQLWAHGVTVVVPSGNDGPAAESVSAPGEDPVLLTAGSVDDRGTPAPDDDVVSGFSGRGPTRWGDDKPDLAAPGEHLVSLRAPGSTVDEQNPSARVDDGYFKGSGTSMSAAITAGAAALVAQAHPDASPDAIKAMLMAGASALDADPTAVGAGVVDAAEAAALDPSALADLPPLPEVDDAEPPFAPRGLGFGWVGAQPQRWMSEKLASRTWNGRTWNSRTWNGRTWTEEEWESRTWAMREWAGRTWNGRTWNSRTWASRTWAGRTWASRTWMSRTWTGRTWAGRTWTQDEWASRTWAGRTWAGRTWAGRTWTDEEWESRTWSSRTWSSRTWSSRTWSSAAWA